MDESEHDIVPLDTMIPVPLVISLFIVLRNLYAEEDSPIIPTAIDNAFNSLRVLNAGTRIMSHATTAHVYTV